MRTRGRRLGERRQPKPQAAGDDLHAELPLGTCYVAVGGYGTVEIRAVHDRSIQGKSVRLALPCRNDGTGEGECILQPTDTLVIHGAEGEITRIPVQEVIERESYAGFRVLLHEQPLESAQSDALSALEQHLAGVSARQLNQKERREREAE